MEEKKVILDKVGNTPIVHIRAFEDSINLYAKLEYYNPMGSIKDRAASYVLSKLLNEGVIDSTTKLIESSSGNYGVALAAYSKFLGLDFTCVIDPLISTINEKLIYSLGANVIKVTKKDMYGGYLHTRLNIVKQFLKMNKNAYWINQYENPLNAEAYEMTIGKEICMSFEQLDYVFIAVSSGGTITGISKALKKTYPNIKIIAVDVEGSVIFGAKPHKRNISGLGSSRVPPILSKAQIDHVEIVSEKRSVECCRELLKDYFLFLGGSSGAIFAAIKQELCKDVFKCCPTVLAIFPDGGNRYADTIFCDEWCSNVFS